MRPLTADLLLDHERLSALVGRPVRATRLRHKPGLSTLAALTRDGRPVGWAHAVTAGHLVKLDKTLHRARERGLTVRICPAGDGITLAWGCLDSDPRLHRALRELGPGSLCGALAAGDLRLLRYNPHRRLVLHRPGPDGGAVLRATTDRQADAGDLPAALHRARVPVLAPATPPHPRPGGRVTVWPWFGVSTLAEAPLAVTPAAGQALARLHRLTALPGRGEVPADAAHPGRVAADLTRLDPGLGASARRVVDALDTRIRAHPWPRVAVHGDFSADQVLVAADGTVRLIDFDRAGAGPALLDLGDFAAVELLTDPVLDDPLDPARTRALLAGHPDPVDPQQLRTWTARALLTRLDAPFRDGHPDWAERIALRLDQVRRVLR